MILLLAGLAQAASCCAPAGSQPTTLGSCDRLGVSLGAGGDATYGGWSWDGSWGGAGDDGGGDARLSLSVVGRATPWLQAGVRAPLTVAVTRLDGAVDTAVGLGEALAWVDLEAPPGWPSARSPRVALDLGVGTEGPSSASPGATVALAAVRVAVPPSTWGAWGDIEARLPVAGPAAQGPPPDGDLQLVVDHRLGARARLGLGVGGTLVAGSWPALGVTLGPSLTWTPTLDDRVLVGLQAAPPLPGFGRSAPGRVVLAVDWFHVLLRSSPSPA